MMFRNTLRLFTFSSVVIIGLSQAATTHSIPWNQLGVEAAKQAGGKGLAVTELWNGYRLECRLQDLQAEITMSGAKILSTSKSDGVGSFTIRVSRLGRTTSMQNLPAVADWITMKGGVVQTGREDLVEEYTTSCDGLGQDFVINNKPEGQGTLLLDLAVEGAGVTTKNLKDGIEVRLSSGRRLAYHALKVNDATGRELTSNFIKTKNNSIAIAVDDKNAMYPVRIDPTISDADWVSIGGNIPGVNWEVYALAVDSSGNLYAGGYFTMAGGATANHIAKWDGNAWNALGNGTDNTVWALAVDSSNNLYAGGLFDSAGGAAANHIAKWDGNAWSNLGSGMNETVQAIAIDRPSGLYAGGWFDSAGGAAANHIARWDGNAWNALGSGTNNAVWALAVDRSDNLYAGGLFTTAGGATANYIAKWDGSAWSALGSGTDNYVLALAADNVGGLYAGGLFYDAGGAAANFIARWNGIAWSALWGGLNSYVYAFAVDNFGNLYAGGRFTTFFNAAANYIAKWDSGGWDSLGSGMNGAVYALAVDRPIGDLYAGGSFTLAGGKTSPNVAMCMLNPTAVIPRMEGKVSRSFLTYDARTNLIRFQLKFPAEISYYIYSLSGRSIFSASEAMGAGTHSLRINTGRAARGSYVLHFKAGSESIRFLLVVDK